MQQGLIDNSGFGFQTFLTNQYQFNQHFWFHAYMPFAQGDLLMDLIGMQQHGFGSRSYNNFSFHRPIRFEIGFIFVF